MTTGVQADIRPGSRLYADMHTGLWTIEQDGRQTSGLEAAWYADMYTGRWTVVQASRQTLGREAARHADMHTGRWTAEQESWLVCNHMDRRVERWKVDLADQQTRRHEHID